MSRALLVLAGLALGIAGIVVVTVVLGARDDPALERPSGPGIAIGATRAQALAGGGTPGDALRTGNVVLIYGDAADAAPLRALAGDLSGPDDPALRRTGQAVILVRRTGRRGVTALAWERALHADSPRDDRLRAFADAWLGRGAQDTR